MKGSTTFWVACIKRLAWAAALWAASGSWMHGEAPIGFDGMNRPGTKARAAVAPHITALRSGCLAEGTLHLVGMRLVPPAERIDVPAGATLLVPIPLVIGDRAASATELADLFPREAQLEGLLTGPGLPATPLVGAIGSGLPVPALGAAGDYLVSGIRISRGGTTLLDAAGASLSIRCLGEVLVNAVTSTPMTMDEIRASGIQLGQGDYVATRFTLALAIGSKRVNLKVPVAIPVYNGQESIVGEPSLERLELDAAGTDLIPDLQVAVGGMSPPSTFSLARPGLAHLARHAFKSLVVIPGSIGYLQQFFKAQVVVLNALPKDRPEYTSYRVGNLSAILNIPASESTALIPGSPLVQGLSGEGGNSVGPGETAAGTWIVKGAREGSHLLEFQIQGEFTGGALTGPVPILGTARTKVLVRNPKFDLLLVHPEVVLRGETYILEARLTNTSGILANGISVGLDQARMGGARIVGPSTLTVDTLAPGETTGLKFRLRALRNGTVIASYLFSESGGIGFQLAAGLGERNVRLNPDTLLLPQSLDPLPEALRDAMLRVLGQAWSIATTKGSLPPGVLPVRASTVTGNLGSALAEAGLFLSMGTERERVWAMLWRAFTQSSDAGFDQLLRSTEAGAELRRELLGARAAWAGGGSLTDRLGLLAAWNLEGELPVLAAIEGGGEGLQVAFLGVDGSQSRATAKETMLGGAWSAFALDGASMLLQQRFPSGGGQLRVANGGTTSQDLRITVATPLDNPALPATLNTYHLILPPGSVATIELGRLRGPPAVISQPGGGTSSAVAESTSDIHPESFRVLSVHRYDLSMDPHATPFGTHVMVLFNKPNRPIHLPDGDPGFRIGSALVQVEGNRLWQKVLPVNPETGLAPPSPPAVVQCLPRVVSVYLERPVGPDIPRNLTLSGEWASAEGEGLAPCAFPILCGEVPGGAQVRGKVRTATGEPMAATLTYWHFVAAEEGGVDLYSGEAFEDSYWALVSNNIEVGADGSFQFDYIPQRAKTAQGMFTLEARTVEGAAYGSAAVLGNGQKLDMDVVLEGRGDVLGRIVDGSGLPIAGADVALYSEQASSGGSLDRNESRVLQTGKDGTFHIPKVLAGAFSLRLRKGDRGAARSSAMPAEGGRVDLGDIRLDAATGTLRVLVLNADGTPSPNQKALLGIPAGLLRSGTQVDFLYVESAGADASGRIAFSQVPAGDVSVRLPYKSGQGPVWYGFLKPGEGLDLTLRLLDPRQLARISVEVRDAAGSPVPGAGLALLYGGQRDTWNARTDTNGQAALPALPDKPFGVIVHHPDWPPEGTASPTLVPRSGENLVMQVNLPPRCAVEGRITRPDGTPVVGAYIAIPPVYNAPARNRLVRTDTKGAYRLVGLATDRGERLACVGPELATGVNQAVQGNAEHAQHLDLQLPFVGTNSLKGRVKQPGASGLPAVADLEAYGFLPDIAPSPQGNPGWGLPVAVLGGVTRSGADGSYRIDGLPSGPFTLQASNVFFPDWVRTTGEFRGPAETLERDLTLVARPAGALEGQIHLPDGQSPGPGGVRVTVTGARIGELMVESGADGRYAFPQALPAGDYTLRADDPKSGAISVEFLRLPANASLIHNIRLWGRGRLTVRVQDSNGRILQDGTVTLLHNLQAAAAASDFPPLGQRLQASSNGTLLWEDLLEGRVKVHLQDPNGLQGVAATEIPFGGGDAEVVVRLQPVGNLRGMLLQPDGTAVPAGRVDAYQGGRWLGLSHTQQEGVVGHFAFTGLPTGVVLLEGWDPDTRQTCRATAQVRENQTTELVLTSNDLGQVDIRVSKAAVPVERATLQVRYLGGSALSFRTEATTDAGGRATFMLPPGDFAIQATDPITLATGALSFTRTPGQGPLDLEVGLRPTRDVVVTVAPPRGWTGTLGGWRLQASKSSHPLRTATLNDQGGSTLTAMMADSYTLTLWDASGRFRGSRSTTVVEGQGPQEVAVQALARGPFQVTLQDAHGAPVAVGRVQARAPGDASTSLPELGTDPDGKVTYPSILEGPVEAVAWSEDRRLHAQGGTSLKSEGTVADLVLSLGPSARFQGILSRSGGQPVPWTLVSYRSEGLRVAGQLATDGTGRFTSPTLPLGTYLLSADDGHGRVGSRPLVMDAVDGLVDADFSLGGSGGFQGTVVDPLRSNVPSVAVELWMQNLIFASSTVDPAGTFLLRDIPVGKPMTVKVRMDDGVTFAYSGSLSLDSDGSMETRTLHLEPRPHLEGHTLAVGGGTHRSMNVQLYDKAGTRLLRRATTSADHPTFQFAYLEPGEYDLRGYDQVSLLARRTVTVAAAPAVQTADLTAWSARDLKLQLKYPDGSVLAAKGHAKLTPILAPADAREGDFDANGNLVLKGLPLGEARLEVNGVRNQPPIAVILTLVTGSGPQEVDVAALGEGSLKVRLKTDAGRDLTGGILVARSAGSPDWVGAAQADGSFQIEQVWVGRDLQLSASGFGVLRAAPAARIASHGQTLEVTWPAPDQGSLRGTVSAAGGQPASGASVFLNGNGPQTTDAAGSYRFDAVTAAGFHTIRAEGIGSSPEWVAVQAQVAADGELKVVDLRLPGTGTVRVTTQDRHGNPAPGVGIVVTTQDRRDAERTAISDPSGQALLENVMAATIAAKATLEGRLVQANGTLHSGSSLALDLRAPDATLVRGSIRRAGAAVPWPSGTVARIAGHSVELRSDGTLGETLDLLYSAVPMTVEVQLPDGGRRFAFAGVPMVKNGDTELDLVAPPFGTVLVTVSKPGGGVASGAHVQGDGGLRATTDASGTCLFADLDRGARTFHAVSGDAAGQASGDLGEDGQQLSVQIALGGRLDVSGRYLDRSGIPLLLFQDGPRIFGTWEKSTPNWVLDGDLAELAFKAPVKDSTGTVKATIEATFTPDGRSLAGSALPLENAWSADRRPGVAVVIEPASVVQRLSSRKPFKAFVAGASEKGVEWSASAGSIAADGVFTAPAEPGPVVLTARSLADPAQQAKAAVEVRRPIVLNPSSLVLQPGQQAIVQAVLADVEPADLVWSATAGILSPAPDNRSVRFTAPEVAGDLVLTVTSDRESGVRASLTIVVVKGTIGLTPESGQLYRGEKVRIWATVSGLADTRLDWTATAGTLAGSGLDVDFTPPQADGPVTVTASSPTNPAVKGSATFQVVRRGTLTLQVATEEGRPLQGKTISLGWAEGGRSQSLVGTSLAFYDLPVGTPITLKDSSVSTGPWNPLLPEQTFTLSSGEAKSLTLSVPMGRMTVQVNRSGAPLADVRVELSIAGKPRVWPWVGGAHGYGNYTDSSGRLAVSDVPMHVAVEATLTWQGRTLPRTFTLSSGSETWPIAWPDHRLVLRISRGGKPVEGVRVDLAGAVNLLEQGPSDSAGLVTLTDLPDHAAITATLRRHPATLVREILLTQSETILDVEWPPLAEVRVELMRPNGQALPPSGWSWSILPGGEGEPPTGDGPRQTWVDLPQGTEQRIAGACAVLFQGSPVFLCTPWSAGVTFTPGQASEVRSLTLPALASVRFVFKDRSGQVLTGPVKGGSLMLRLKDAACGGPTLAVSEFSQAVLPEIVPEGTHTFELHSWPWGMLAPVRVTITAADDGKEILAPVVLPWSVSSLDLQIRAGDHATPVPDADLVLLRADGSEAVLARSSAWDAERGTLLELHGPDQEDVTLQARFRPRRQPVPLRSPALAFRTGGNLKAILEIPLTVVRTRLTGTDGSALEAQGLVALGEGEPGQPDRCPTVDLGGVKHGVLLGEPASSRVALGLYDPDSGLGQRVTITVPALGSIHTEERALAPHAWLRSASLASTSGESPLRLLLAMDAEAPGMVWPDGSSWLWDGSGFTALPLAAWLSEEGLRPGYRVDYWDPTEVPDLEDPPQPTGRWLPQVRVPLTGGLWAAEWNLRGTAVEDGSGAPAYVAVEAQAGRWGRLPLEAKAGEELSVELVESTPAWVPAQVRMLGLSEQPLLVEAQRNLRLGLRPHPGPWAWELPVGAGPDEQGWWSAILPVQIPLLLESFPWDCGKAGTWWSGSLAFTATQPPPAVVPVLTLQETPLPPCPPPVPVPAGSPRRNRSQASRRSRLP